MVPPRLLAITGNLSFIVYAVRAGLHPVLLYAFLLPTNLYRPDRATPEGPLRAVNRGTSPPFAHTSTARGGAPTPGGGRLTRFHPARRG